MAEPIVLQDVFDQGVKRDVARDRMPKGSLWWAADVIPNLGAKLRERGGWTSASNDIAATTATAAYVIGGLYAPFVAAAKNLAIDEDGRLYSIAADGTVTDIGAAVAVSQNPVFHRDKAIIFAAGGATAPKYYDGSTLGNLGGSPPNAVYATVFNDRTVAGRTSANTNRVWFSDAGDPAGWDTTNTYWDFTYPVTGLAAFRTAILAFHDRATSRLRGSTPPPGSDFIADDPLFDVGCTDARSIAYWRDKVIFANGDGLFITDGAGVDDLTRLCGMQTYWQETLSGYSSSWSIAGGVMREHYVVAVMNGSTFKTAAMIDLRRLAWWPVTNVNAVAFWRNVAGGEELYFGRRDAARVGSFGSVFMPAAAVKNDGDGDAVAATLETPFYRGGYQSKRWRRVYSTHLLKDYATDNPTLAVSYVTTPEATSYTSVASFSENTAETRPRMALPAKSRGLGLKLARANAGDFRLSAILAEVSALEGSR